MQILNMKCESIIQTGKRILREGEQFKDVKEIPFSKTLAAPRNTNLFNKENTKYETWDSVGLDD